MLRTARDTQLYSRLVIFSIWCICLFNYRILCVFLSKRLLLAPVSLTNVKHYFRIIFIFSIDVEKPVDAINSKRLYEVMFVCMRAPLQQLIMYMDAGETILMQIYI